jgi:adenylate cyclase
MSEPYEKQEGNEELWKTIFADGHPELLKQHWLHTKLPREPRCRMCLVPFKGIGGWFMRRKGKTQNSRNPNYCSACDKFMEAFPGGAEVEMSLLYVDIRQSTQYAANNTPENVSERINTFLDQATRTITQHDGFVMAFYGDCVVASWPPGFSGDDHAQKAQRAAIELVTNKQMVDGSGNPIPVGVGVHTGNVFIGTVSAMQGSFRDVSIFGSSVNLTARLASQAEPNQALASAENIQASGKALDSFSSQQVELKGFEEPVNIYSLA